MRPRFLIEHDIGANHVGVCRWQRRKFTRPDHALSGSNEREILCAGLAAHLVGLQLERHFLPFAKPGQACPLHRTDVDEHVVSTIERLDEAKTLLTVKPLHNTCSHVSLRGQKRPMPARPPCRLQFNLNDVSGKEAWAAISKLARSNRIART